MKLFSILILINLLISCQQKEINYSEVILENEIINTEFLQETDASEKALINGYLFAYGNECTSEKSHIKCDILKELSIENECDSDHISKLQKWFSEDLMMKIKLLNCPNLPQKGAIQNTIYKIELKRKNDTITIVFGVKGLNNSQEKSWDIEQSNSYIIKNETFIILK